MLDLVTGLLVLFLGPVLVIWWLPYLIHEIGHAAGAALVGARLDYVPLGPFVMTRTGEGVRIRRQVRRYSCDAVLPPRRSARWRLFAATLSGPLANIGLGVALLVLGFAGDLDRIAFLGPLILLIAGLFMTLHGFATLLPWRPYGAPSDGRRLLSLLVWSSSAQRWVALRLIAASSDAGIRPRDWDPELLNALVTPSDGSIDDVAGALNLYWHLLDSGRLGEARACLEQARAAATQRYLTQLTSQLVLLELAYMEARSGMDPSLAVEHLARSATIGRTTLARVVVAVQLAYADLPAAERTLEAAKRHLGELRPGFGLMETTLLHDLADEARRRREGIPTQKSGPVVSGTAVDVGRFATPDVEIRPTPPPAGLRSTLTVAGLASSVMLGFTWYVSAAAFSQQLAVPIAVAAAVLSALALLRVRSSRGAHRVEPLRQMFAALGTMAIASPQLVGDLFRPNSLGYIWIAGQVRPCLAFGAGHDIASIPVYLFASAFALLGLLIATRVNDEPIFPRRGILVGIGLLLVWVITVGADHRPFATMIGCT